MTAYPYRTLTAWVATLSLIWVGLCSPWPLAWNVVVAILVVFAAVIAMVRMTGWLRAQRDAARHVLGAIDAALSSLPPNIKRHTPLMLTVGDENGPLADVFGTDHVRVTDAAIWVRSEDTTQLAHMTVALKRWRDGQGPDAVAFLISADRAVSQPSLAASLKRWHLAARQASRSVGYCLPVCVAIYAEELQRAPDECPWFGVSSQEPLDIDGLVALVASRVETDIRMAIAMNREPRAHRAARLDGLTRWACNAVLPQLVDEQCNSHGLHLAAFGVVAIEGHPAAHSLFGQFVASTTGLMLPVTNGVRLPYPLPEPLIRGIALQPVRRALPRVLAYAFVWLAAAFCAAAAASAWQNRALVERVVGNMKRYQAIAPSQDAARSDALKAVKRDRDELEGYDVSGVPPRLGLGFYRGSRLLQLANDLIASYQPPAPPPSTIELNSLSLFRSGSAVLSPGSNRVLVEALDMVRTHPDKRVLVAGHTDSVGTSAGNLVLSTARAASVRDWLAEASGIAASHFAIQGYGDTRPKESNDTEQGRAANRRVEITLVPDCRDTHDSRNDSTTQGHLACS